jgi:hypothetical protein
MIVSWSIPIALEWQAEDDMETSWYRLAEGCCAIESTGETWADEKAVGDH